MPSRKALNKAQHAFKRALQTQGPMAAQVALDRRGGQLPPEMKARAQQMIDQAKRNMGGPIMGYNTGGYLSEEEEKKRREMMSRSRVASSNVPNAPLAPKQQAMGGGGGGGSSPLGQIGQKLAMKAIGSLFGLPFNQGGSVPSNPHGYNEGGATQATPLKKVMDEDKIEMAREAFERGEARKDQKAAAEERRAEAKFKQDMSMKKAAATTNKAPLAKK